MPTTEADGPARPGRGVRATTSAVASAPPRRTPLPLLAVLLMALLLVALHLAGVSAATAEPDGDNGPIPSQEDVDRAERRVLTAAERVAQIQAALSLANARLESAAVTAERAYEAYHGARWRLQLSQARLRAATEDASTADERLRRQRDVLAGLVVASYQGADGISALQALEGPGGPEDVMTRLLTYDGATTSLESRWQRFAATLALARAFRARALAARERHQDLLDAAERARDVAQAAAQEAQETAATIDAEKAELVAELASLQQTSVEIVQRRQEALERIEQRRQARRAAAELRAQMEQQSQDPDPPRPGPTPTDPSSPPAPVPPSSPPDPPPAAEPPPPRPLGGAARALAFARAQLGEPYSWGAAGPNAWDCSGLTMAAWRAGGRSLPHYSVAQYQQSTPIRVDQLRPGDLVFWASGGSPGTIHHVALYAGAGMVIHAPRTGRPVSVDSMYYWVPPTFFARV